MATIIHFDIPADDPERAKGFYEALFGWKIGPIAGFPGYYEIGTSDLNGEKGIGGGITKGEQPRQTGITNFVGVASINESMEKVSKLGGKIIRGREAVPGYGSMALCADTENNVFGLFQEDK
ncbi:MAG TPA: VOC family protein [Puia sp.]|uniref:VOC family protein n=1 Tax=Puia sp. TaxID=2045100 RepID=UPI002BE33260|nr:VOC family protein [Puia sp.]HVU97098.1 VOC family protein [Puia sp.]